VESCVEARTNLEFGENLTCELRWKVEIHSCKKDTNVTNQIGLSSSTKVFKHWPDSASHIRLVSCEYMMDNLYLPTYIRPSIAQDTMSVPSWLKLTDVTGSEWAGSTFKGLPCPVNSLNEQNQTRNYITSCNVPNTDSFIKSSGGKKIWIRIIVQTKNKIGVTKKGFHLTAL
jgi:hypothetical protein